MLGRGFRQHHLKSAILGWENRHFGGLKSAKNFRTYMGASGGLRGQPDHNAQRTSARLRASHQKDLDFGNLPAHAKATSIR
jgi:hypothetical protein